MNKVYKHIGCNKVMYFENDSTEIYGRNLGFLTGYLLLTAMLFIILKISSRIPDGWTIIHISIITVIVTMTGYAITKILK